MTMRIETTSVASFSPTGAMLALGTKAKLLDKNFSPESSLEVYDLSRKNVLYKQEVHARYNQLCWGQHKDQLFIAGGQDRGELTLLDVTCLLSREDSTSQKPEDIPFKNNVQPGDDVLCVDFAQKLPLLIAGSAGGKLSLWNMQTLDKPMTPGSSTKYEGISSVQWNKKVPQVLAVGTMDGVVSVLDLRTKAEVSRIVGQYFSKSEISGLQWDPTSTTQLAVTSSSSECRDMVVYDLRVGRGTHRLPGHADGITCCRWSEADSSLCITCGADGDVIAWDMKGYAKRGVVVKEACFDFQYSPEHPDMIAYSTFNGEVCVDMLSSINTRVSFMEAVPSWHRTSRVGFTSSGIISGDEKVHPFPWDSEPASRSCEQEIVLALAADKNTQREILKILDAPEENTPIDAEAEKEEGTEQNTNEYDHLHIDKTDEVTGRLIHGDFSGAFRVALAEDARIAALLALCQGPEVLRREKRRILTAPGASSSFLLLFSILSGDYDTLIQHNVDWEVLVKILARHCPADEFVKKAHALAEGLEEKSPRGAKMCYLMSRDIQKFLDIEEQQYSLPASIHEAREFYEDYARVFSVIEQGAKAVGQKLAIKNKTIEYLKHLLQNNETDRVTAFLACLTPESAAVASKVLGLEAAQEKEKVPYRGDTRSESMPRMRAHNVPPIPKPATSGFSAPSPSHAVGSGPSTAPPGAGLNSAPQRIHSGYTSAIPRMQQPPVGGGRIQPPAPAPAPLPPQMPLQAPRTVPPSMAAAPSSSAGAPGMQQTGPQQIGPQVTGYGNGDRQEKNKTTVITGGKGGQKISFVKTQSPTAPLGARTFQPPLPPRPPQAQIRPPGLSSSPSLSLDAGATRGSVSMPMPRGLQSQRQVPIQKQPGLAVTEHPKEEQKLTPEMEKSYAKIANVLARLRTLLAQKDGSLKTWLLKTITPKLEVLDRHLEEKKWDAPFLQRMDAFAEHIEQLGIYSPDPTVSNSDLDSVRKQGDEILATRPLGTEIEVWMTAIYSLMKVALH